MPPALLTAQNCTGHVHLIIGSGPLAASRCARSREVGAKPVLVAPENERLHYTLPDHISNGTITWTRRSFDEDDLRSLGRPEVNGYVDAVFVTLPARDELSQHISQLCRRLRIPVNVVDASSLCTFTLLSTHTDGPLQIGITTSGRGCKLSSRIRREIAHSLPPNFGDAVERLGSMRKQIGEEDYKLQDASSGDAAPDREEEESTNQKHTFNKLVKEDDKTLQTSKTRRMRWLSQICEYWPLSRLASITDQDVATILNAYKASSTLPGPSPGPTATDTSTSLPVSRRGTISLIGSGPGHPSLLTVAASTAINSASYILADKLVPSSILALIPRRTPVHIARKFPGNADAAQQEMLDLALQALKEGKNVLRLKQGDPYLYGRGAEEVAFFREHGYDPMVVPGVTSALSAPMFAEIPVTHRAVADEVVICTGTGRKGAAPDPPSYKASKTVVFLMALHRLESLVQSLTGGEAAPEPQDTTTRPSPLPERPRLLWPESTPCAVIERASCPDQRVIRSTLEHVCQAVEEEGSRPPGLLIVGNACHVLRKPVEGSRWVTEEGFRGLYGILQQTSGLDILQELESSERDDGAGVNGVNGVHQAVGSVHQAVGSVHQAVGSVQGIAV